MDDKAVVNLRSQLEYYFSEKAGYRDRLTEKFPWTAGKNDNYAKSLRKMAEYVMSLPASDPILHRIAEATYDENCGIFVFEPSNSSGSIDGISFAGQDAIHCGPRSRTIETSDCPEWFASWAETLISEAADRKTCERFGEM